MFRGLCANLERSLVGAVLVVTAGLVCLQVVVRFVGKIAPALSMSFSFTEEIARFGLVWCTMLGTAAAVREGAHLGVVFLSRRLPERWGRWVPLMGLAAMATLFGLVCVTGIAYVAQGIRMKETSSGMGLPIWVLRLAIPVGGALVVGRCIEACVRLFLRQGP